MEGLTLSPGTQEIRMLAVFVEKLSPELQCNWVNGHYWLKAILAKKKGTCEGQASLILEELPPSYG